MQGTGRVRYCPECKLNVYNFSEMSPAEIEALVTAKTGRLCARFYQRADGTMLTQNCPVGFRGAILRATRLAGATLTAILSLAHTKPTSAQSQSGGPLVQIQSSEKTLTIEVVDPTGAVIPRAVISLIANPSETPQQWSTNGEGVARISGLSPGPHTFEVNAVGFARRKLQVGSSGSGALTVRLETGVLVMGGLMEAPITPGLEAVSIPSQLKMPDPTDVPNISQPKDNRNAFRRFFSKLGRLF